MSDRCISFCEVNAMDLGEALHNEASLVLLNFASGILLNMKNPLAADNTGAGGWMFDKFPCAVRLERAHLFLDGLLPSRPVWTSLCFCIVWH